MKSRFNLLMILSLLLVSSCTKNTFDDDLEKEMISNNATKVFGVEFDKTHDWITTISDDATINVVGDDINVIQIVAHIFEGEDSVTSIKKLNEIEIKGEKTVKLHYDAPLNTIALYSVQISNSRTVYNKIENNKLKTTRAAESETGYVLPDVELKLAGYIESYASERGWISGERLYYIDDYVSQKMEVDDYDTDYKALFNDIIFSCFKNGRKYNNLPLVKSSGYYNDKVYPITTGKDPIVVSPVYKNDGGYEEVVNSDLYYYYFKESDLGNDPVSYLESLPKYKAIQFDQCIKGDNVTCKHASYALIYWGDGFPNENTVGKYNFPKGYKIGFMVRAKTTAENCKKQGELYGDGRLNNYINKYDKCNFKSSKLGENGPRAAWMNINDRMLLCFESGTDTDFNDIILEVEGGIEPFNPYIDPESNFYTFCFEDTKVGDYDLNDVVIKASRINNKKVEYRIVACGAYDKLYIKGINGTIINDSKDVHSMFGVEKEYINTVKGAKTYEPIVDVVNVPESFSFLDENTQPYIYDETTGNVVKISRMGEDPHAIMIPYDFKYPTEKTCVKTAYDQFNSWGVNKVESTDWYKYPNDNYVY